VDETIEEYQRTNRGYEDEYDLITKFVFDPNLPSQGLSKAKFGHINKNLQLTSLDTKDVDEIRGYLDAIQVLNRFNQNIFVDTSGDNEERITKEKAKQLYLKRKKEKQRGERDEINIKHKVKNRFEEVKDLFLSEVYSITTTSAGKDGELIKLWNTDRKRERQTLRDETEPTFNVPFIDNNKDKRRRR